jgi:PKD repeat protein
LTVQADASGSNDPDGPLDVVLWDFGDGTTQTGPTASHTYEHSGDYAVSLSVYDSSGEAGFASQSVSVTDSPADLGDQPTTETEPTPEPEPTTPSTTATSSAPASVLGISTVPDPEPDASAAAGSVEGDLPTTGGDTGRLVWGGSLLVGLGLVVAAIGRRRRSGEHRI